MSWNLFGKIVILIVINSFVANFVACLHDTFCKKCKV